MALSDEIVEKAAIALRNSEFAAGRCLHTWRDTGESARETYRVYAVAALRAVGFETLVEAVKIAKGRYLWMWGPLPGHTETAEELRAISAALAASDPKCK